jgi:hypothetical protein
VVWTDQVQFPGRLPEYWKRSYSPVYDDHGSLNMIVGLSSGVTDELHRSAELELLSQVTQNSTASALLADATENIEDGRITFVNRVASRLLTGNERRSLVGRSLAEISSLI